MATAAQNEILAFREFLGNRINDGVVTTPEEIVQEFREQQQQLERARRELGISHDEFLQGKAKPLDVAELMDRVGTRLADGESDG